jgi:hypothetical protein
MLTLTIVPPLCRPAAWACQWRRIGTRAILAAKETLSD